MPVAEGDVDLALMALQIEVRGVTGEITAATVLGGSAQVRIGEGILDDRSGV